MSNQSEEIEKIKSIHNDEIQQRIEASIHFQKQFQHQNETILNQTQQIEQFKVEIVSFLKQSFGLT